MQPSLPELPPMKPATQSVSPSSSSPPAASEIAAKTGFGGTKRLRQIVTTVAGGGFAFVALVCAGEVALRPGLRPTDLMATIEAQTELSIMNQKLGSARGDLPLTEADYQKALAQAQRAGQAKAEIGFQRQLAVVQADKERVVGAYQALYQRTNIIAQAGVQMEAQALQFRQRLIEQANGGRVIVIAVYDGLCAVGDADSCEKARQARAGMIEESTALTEGEMARKVNELMAGIPDPAALVAQEDERKNGTPALPR